jgi:Fe-S cluster assembly ATPase SufC
MIDARILVEIGLKRHFGSILAVMGSNTSAKGSSAPTLERLIT